MVRLGNTPINTEVMISLEASCALYTTLQEVIVSIQSDVE